MKEYGCWSRDAWGYFFPSKATFCAAGVGGFLLSRMHIHKIKTSAAEVCERSWEVRSRALKMEGENCKQENNNVRDGACFLFFSFFLFVITFCRFQNSFKQEFPALFKCVCVSKETRGQPVEGGKRELFCHLIRFSHFNGERLKTQNVSLFQLLLPLMYDTAWHSRYTRSRCCISSVCNV